VRGTVPLCRGHHRQLHQAGNEVTWWEDLKINALEIAKGLCALGGKPDEGISNRSKDTSTASAQGSTQGGQASRSEQITERIQLMPKPMGNHAGLLD